jgi:endonuclease-3
VVNARPTTATRPKATTKPKPKPKSKKRKLDPVKVWANTMRRYRPGLPQYVIGNLTQLYGAPVWERRLDPTSELILTILTQNTADINAEVAFQRLREAFPGSGPEEIHNPGIGWGGMGLPPGVAPDWAAVEGAEIPHLTNVIRPGGLANQKAPRLQATLRRIREERGDYSLEFLADKPALEARDWLTSIPGIGKKTASILLLFCFGTPLMPVDRHVERVSRRIGLLPTKGTDDQAHDFYLGLLEPDEMYAAHVLLIHHGRAICHAQRPEHERCPVRDRCRFVDPKAP